MVDTAGFGMQTISQSSTAERLLGSDQAATGGSRTEGDSIELQSVTTSQTPDLHPLTLQITRGHHTLILSTSPLHRHILSKLLTGKHEPAQGTLCCPRPAEIMVITSKPYVKPGGSMWEQVIFPHIKSQSLKRNVTEHHLTGLVQALGLERELFLDLCDHDWGRVSDWTKILKPHGMLALAIARTMYLQPKYALVDDDALQMLAAEQVRRLVEVAGHHHVTLLISAATMPTATTPAPGYLPAMAQIARVLEISCSEWRFAAVGASRERRAFDVDEPARPVWQTVGAAAAAAGGIGDLLQQQQARLLRRASTLSQCSTTERRWLICPDPHILPSGRQSPALTSRSSSSDISSDLSSRLKISADLPPVTTPVPVPVPVAESLKDTATPATIRLADNSNGDGEEDEEETVGVAESSAEIPGKVSASGIPRPCQKELPEPVAGPRQYARTAPRSYARPTSRVAGTVTAVASAPVNRPFSRADGELLTPEVAQEGFVQALYASPTKIPRPAAHRRHQTDSASISSVSSTASSSVSSGSSRAVMAAAAPRVYVAKSAIRTDDVLALN